MADFDEISDDIIGLEEVESGNKNKSALLDGKYFRVFTVTGETVKAICQACGSNSKPLSATFRSTGNLLKHLKVCVTYYIFTSYYYYYVNVVI
jgi:thioredoxin reductase